MNGEAFVAALLSGAVIAGLPLLLAGLGEQMAQRAGMLNIGLEGMMLAGGFAAFLAALASEASWPGLLAGAAVGAAAAALVALLCVRMALDQVVVGIALTLAAQGLTSLLHRAWFSGTYPRLPGALRWPVPGLSDIPVVGPSLFTLPPLAYAAALLTVAVGLLYRRTALGPMLTAAGERPMALELAGGDVRRLRTSVMLVTGTLAGLGGAALVLIGAGLFVPGVTNGAGYIAIVLAMLARGRAVRVLLGAMVFGACLSATTALQLTGASVPTDIVQMLPFAAILVLLVALGRRGALPAALGQPFRRRR